MRFWIAKVSEIFPQAQPKQTFFAKQIDSLPDDLVERLLAFEKDADEVRRWLSKVQVMEFNPSDDPNTLEVPKCLEAPSVERPKKKATAQRSSKKSPSKRRKTASKSSTSRKKAE